MISKKYFQSECVNKKENFIIVSTMNIYMMVNMMVIY